MPKIWSRAGDSWQLAVIFCVPFLGGSGIQRRATSGILVRVRPDIPTDLHRGRKLRHLLVVLTVLMVLGVASGASAQAGLTDPPSQTEPPVKPDPEPTPTPTPTPESDDAPKPTEKPAERVETVPEEGEGASSDRIRYQDPLDIKQESMKLKWNNFLSGLKGITQYSLWDNQLRFRLGFRVQGDATLVAPSDQTEAALGPMPNSFDVRRARVFAEGIIKKMYFRFEFDFGADTGFKSAYFEGREGGLEIWGHLLGKFRYGYFQEPFSLEQNLSSFDTAFVEVSLPVTTIAPGNNIGAMVYDASKNRRWTWAFGAFSWGQGGDDNASTSSLSLTGRFGFQPLKYVDQDTAIHIGVSLSTRSPSGSNVQYHSRPEARFVEFFADTGDIPSNKTNLVSLETAWRKRSTWAQAEWIRANVDSTTNNYHFDGIAIQAGFFLTGYMRPWDSLFATWGRVRPEKNYRGGSPFKKAKGGLWEVAARYSTVNLTNGEVHGGEVRDLTAGVNWYPSTTSKIQFNWIHSRTEDIGYANIWVLRYQYAIK